MGIWPPNADGTDINALDVLTSKDLVNKCIFFIQFYFFSSCYHIIDFPIYFILFILTFSFQSLAI